jgi:2-oxoglutarate ferredoxin oxidoreductase subunit delta
MPVSMFRGEAGKKPSRSAGRWEVTVEGDFCKACRFCIEVCPVDVFAWSPTVNARGWFPVEVAHEANCVGCMLCYQLCPDFVINVEAREASA